MVFSWVRFLALKLIKDIKFILDKKEEYLITGNDWKLQIWKTDKLQLTEVISRELKGKIIFMI